MSRPKHAVVIITTPPGWLPTRIHSLPPEIVSARFYSKNLRRVEAIAVAKIFNKTHLNPPAFQGEWALCVLALRGSKRMDGGKGALARRQAIEGGTASPVLPMGDKLEGGEPNV